MIREAPSGAVQPVANLLHAVDLAVAEMHGEFAGHQRRLQGLGMANPRRPAREVSVAALHMPTDGAGVHQARVSHLVGAPCGTTALPGLHRLMPVLVPAVVPLVPSNKANEPSLHGAAFPTEPTLRIQASGVHDEARSRAERSVGCRHACLPNCLPIGSTWTDHAGIQAAARYALRSCQTRADLG
jgi:hypothetical protein